MKHLLYLIIITLSFTACKTDSKKLETVLAKGDTLAVNYAKGFTIVDYQDFKILTVINPWPDADKDYTYLLAKDNSAIPESLQFDQKIKIPLKHVVVTSTTHIPSLDMLGEIETLAGFPNLDYVSTESARKRITAGKVKELGANESINTEVLLELQPEAVIGFAIDGQNKTFNTIQKNGIPVLFNADWLEANPLGKAEWIKFFGALYDKQDLATEKFEAIATAYNATKKLAKSASNMPTVLSGSMYKDIWYLPYGDSWQAQFIKDANGKYIYNYTRGKGSISLAFEKVLDKAQNTDVWVAPGSFTTYDAMIEATPHYNQFKAFKDKQIFSFAGVTGETGGVLFYELGPNRPDLILKDLVKALHPELLEDYTPTFLKPLD